MEGCFFALAHAPETPLLPLAAWLCLAGLFYLIAVVWALRPRPSLCPPGSPGSTAGRGAARFVILAAVVFRLTLLPLTPTLSHQAWRFHWDGRIQGAGFNPYEYPPQNSLFNPIRTTADSNVPAPAVGAYHPPLAELLFRWNYDWVGGGLRAGKILFVIFDLLLIWQLVRMLRERGWAAERVLIYAWSPLAVFEIAGNGHMAPVAALLALLALRWAGRWPKRAAVAVASAFSAAWFAITLIPAVVGARLAPGARRRWAPVTAWIIGTAVFWTLPYIWVQRHLGWGMIAANVHSHALASPVVNASLYAIFLTWFGRLGATVLALVVLGAVIVLATLRMRQPGEGGANPALAVENAALRAGFVILGAMLLVLPQVHPWSVLWLLPLAVFWPEPAWMYFSVAVWFAYALPSAPRLIWVEYVPVFALLAWQARRPARSLPCPDPEPQVAPPPAAPHHG